MSKEEMLTGPSQYQTDCVNFDWKFVNYRKGIEIDSFYSGASRMYIPTCLETQATLMFYRPIDHPCEGCPYYEQGEEKGRIPPGGYDK